MLRPSKERHNAGTLEYRDLSIAHFAGHFSKTSLMLIKDRPFPHQKPCAPSSSGSGLTTQRGSCGFTVNHTEKIKSQVLAKLGTPPRLNRVEVCNHHNGKTG
jgi:hypothetical protein